jgi:hypothetical protein
LNINIYQHLFSNIGSLDLLRNEQIYLRLQRASTFFLIQKADHAEDSKEIKEDNENCFTQFLPEEIKPI